MFSGGNKIHLHYDSISDLKNIHNLRKLSWSLFDTGWKESLCEIISLKRFMTKFSKGIYETTRKFT